MAVLGRPKIYYVRRMAAAATFKDAYRVGVAIARVLGDSTKTHEIHRVEEITGRPRYRRLLAELPTTAEGRRLLVERPELSTDHVDYDELRRLPATTLGGAYVRHLDDNGITADYQAAATRHVEDPDMAYLMRRFRQTHDVWHALLGIGITGHEEVLIHWFSFGQLRLPVSLLIMVFGTMKHLVLEQRWAALRHSAIEAYTAGRDAEPLLPVIWEDLWQAPLDEVRARYNVRPLDRARFDRADASRGPGAMAS
jgi:ubiquinone biosynthesis protein COQ4